MRSVFTGILPAALVLLLAAGCRSGPRGAHAGSRDGADGSGYGVAGQPGFRGGQGEVAARLPADERARVLEAHNRFRREVGVEPLVWSIDLAAFAQAWASRLAASGGGIRHRPKAGEWARRHGENIFMGTAGAYSPVQAVEAWAAEKRRYRRGPVGWSNLEDFGHYTQIVWRGTARVGCGAAVGGGMLYVVCNYDPPGNVLGLSAY